MTNNNNPRRSALYVPGSNEKALKKSPGLAADAIIFDLEDAVALSMKDQAREQVRALLASGVITGTGTECIVRINHLDTPYGLQDLEALATVNPDGICIPKAESIESINEVLAVLGADIPVWVNIETPQGVLNVEQIAAHPAVAVIVMGTNDLSRCMRFHKIPGLTAFHYTFSRCIMAARAFDCDILDGVYNAFKDEAGFALACQEAKSLGFDGKTLIHPAQIEPANTCFSPDEEAIVWSEKVVAAWAARDREQGIAVLEGQIIELLHVENAERILAIRKD